MLKDNYKFRRKQQLQKEITSASIVSDVAENGKITKNGRIRDSMHMSRFTNYILTYT